MLQREVPVLVSNGPENAPLRFNFGDKGDKDAEKTSSDALDALNGYASDSD
jgi:hypothetical protein